MSTNKSEQIERSTNGRIFNLFTFLDLFVDITSNSYYIHSNSKTFTSVSIGKKRKYQGTQITIST